MGREQYHNAYDHKVLVCPQNPRKHVDAWRSDNRLILITTDLPDRKTRILIETVTIAAIQQLHATRPFQCPECTGNWCNVVSEGTTKVKEIPGAFRSIKIVPVHIEELLHV